MISFFMFLLRLISKVHESFYAKPMIILIIICLLKQLLEKLYTIRLSCSQYLIEVPDISISAPNLGKLILDGCSNLLKLHPIIGKLRKLILLSLRNCKKLSSFLSITNLEALKNLNLSGISGLKKFPDIQGNMEHLLELYLAATAIQEIPSSIEHLTGLVLFDLKSCKYHMSLRSMVHTLNMKKINKLSKIVKCVYTMKTL